jgi:hypothetical protein
MRARRDHVPSICVFSHLLSGWFYVRMHDGHSRYPIATSSGSHLYKMFSIGVVAITSTPENKYYRIHRVMFILVDSTSAASVAVPEFPGQWLELHEEEGTGIQCLGINSRA